MTEERQDILEDFYSGNAKVIRDVVVKSDGSPKSLVGAEITYAMVTDKDLIVLRKSSAAGSSEIEIIDAVNGEFVIKLRPQDTMNLAGTFRHYVNVVDSNGDEETVTTGKVNIKKTHAQRYRVSSRPIYLVGVAV